MKRRLLFLFAVFTVATSVGWGQGASSPTYYKVESRTGGDGSKGSPLLKASLDAALSDAQNVMDSVVILLPNGSYTTNSASFTINHPSLAIIGEGDTSTVTLTSPVDITLQSGGYVSFERVHLDVETDKGRGVVDIKSSNTIVSFLDSKVTIKGAGSADGGPTVCFGIVSQLSVDNNTVNFIRSRMYMSKGFERGLAFRDGAGHTLNFINSQMDGPSAKGQYPYVIGICSWPGGTSCKNPVTYNIKNSTIDINYYAVFSNNQSGADVPVNITIDNCSITAWSALYLRGDNAGVTFPHNVNITNTRMFGRSYQNGPSDGFGTIVFEVCPQLDLTMDTRCSIVSENMVPISDPPTYMCVADIRQTNGTWRFVPSGTSKCTIQSNNDAYAPVLFFRKSSSSLDIIGAEEVEFKAQNEKPCIVSFKADNSLKNAASSLDALLTNTTLEDGDKVIFPEGEYTLPQILSLDKSITIHGAGKDKTTIKGAILFNGSANDIATHFKIERLSLDYTPTKVSSGKCAPIIEVTGNVDLLIDDCVMNNNTQGYGDRKNEKPAEVLQNAILLGSMAKGTVRVDNTIINLAANSQAGVLVDGELTNVSLFNTRIEGIEKGSNQFGLYIHHKKTPVVLDSTTILLNNHYCIYANNAGDQELKIMNKSNMVGYGALYLYETSNMNIHVSGESTLTGTTKNKGVSDSFAALTISTNNSTAEASNNTIVIEDSYIGNKFDEQETRAMTPIKINSYTPTPFNNKIILKGKTIVSTSDNIKNPTIVGYGMNPDEYNNVVMVEGNDVQFQDQNGKSCVIINKSDGSFRNATVSIVTAIDFGELYEDTYYHEGVAYAGDIIMIQDTTIAQALSSLNAAEYAFFEAPALATTWEPYVVPDGIIFDCKDGCLVIGEEQTTVFAQDNPYKRVYRLNQGDKSFTLSECVVTINIAKDTIWATTFDGRNVNIKDGATLTLSTPMSLDTVTMEEGAQLVSMLTDPGQRVTAKALRFALELSGDKWKALGVPFSDLVIQNSKGEEVSAPSEQEADDGIWFAGLKDDKTPEFAVNESAFGTAGLWAANGDSYTISSKDEFEIKIAEEPTAPIVEGTFLMCVNPNTYTFNLTQPAYVLSEDGTSFEQVSNPEIKPFQSFVLTDANTLNTLRSLRLGDNIVTGTQTIEPVEGYYVSTERGAIVIHTAEPVQVLIVEMSGRIAYKGMATDGQRIVVPTGIYAVNGQLVRVK